MFGIDSSELLIVAVAALIFIGPKDLPRVMMVVGRWVGRARGYARHFTAGIENIVREAELEEMEKKWRDENARIMAQFPSTANYPDPFNSVTPAQAGAEPDQTNFPEQDWVSASAGITKTPPSGPTAEEPVLPLDLPPSRELP
ncbi:MAG: twin-arginine translocase subunit TatB [Sphingomicrobium sp.]